MFMGQSIPTNLTMAHMIAHSNGPMVARGVEMDPSQGVLFIINLSRASLGLISKI